MSNQPLRGEDFWRTDPGPSSGAPTDEGEADSARPADGNPWQIAADAWEAEPAPPSTEPTDTTWPASTGATPSTGPGSVESAASTWPAAVESSDSTGPGWKDDAPTPPQKVNQLLWLAVGALVIGLPVTVGVVAFLQPPASSPAPHGGEPVVATAAPPPAPAVDQIELTQPTWSRPTWANTVSDATVYELQASTDVPFANGRMRPRLGVRCTDGTLDVHVVTGGTAPIDPETSRHLVRVGFDGAAGQPERWVGAADQRALFAPDPAALMARIARAEQLEFAYTHYMVGSIPVTFNLTGADEIVESVTAACG